MHYATESATRKYIADETKPSTIHHELQKLHLRPRTDFHRVGQPHEGEVRFAHAELRAHGGRERRVPRRPRAVWMGAQERGFAGELAGKFACVLQRIALGCVLHTLHSDHKAP